MSDESRPPMPLPHREIPVARELRLPEVVRNELVRGAASVLGHLGTENPQTKELQVRPDAPEAVVVLMRSAKLPMETVNAYLSSHPVSGTLPPQAEVGIGKILPLTCIDELSQTDGSIEEGVDLIRIKPQYTAWLEKDGNPAVAAIARSLHEQLPKVGTEKPPRLLVVDDARGQGDTLDHTVGPVLKKTYGAGVTHKAELIFANQFPKGTGWEYLIVDENFTDVTPGQRYLLHELLKGYVDERVLRREAEFLPAGSAERQEYDARLEHLHQKYPDTPFFPIEDMSGLHLLAAHSRLYSINEADQNPAALLNGLEEKYGTDYLLEIPNKMKSLFREAAKDVKLA